MEPRNYRVLSRWTDGAGVMWVTAICGGRTVTVSYRDGEV
jgi:hypothetical protein